MAKVLLMISYFRYSFQYTSVSHMTTETSLPSSYSVQVCATQIWTNCYTSDQKWEIQSSQSVRYFYYKHGSSDFGSEWWLWGGARIDRPNLAAILVGGRSALTAPPTKMATEEVVEWVSDQLHELLGLSDRYMPSTLLGWPERRLHQSLTCSSWKKRAPLDYCERGAGSLVSRSRPRSLRRVGSATRDYRVTAVPSLVSDSCGTACRTNPLWRSLLVRKSASWYRPGLKQAGPILNAFTSLARFKNQVKATSSTPSFVNHQATCTKPKTLNSKS